MIKVYSKKDCSQCVATIKYLEKKEVSFELHIVDEDEDSLGFVKNLGYMALPVVYQNEYEHWSGFRPDKLSAL